MGTKLWILFTLIVVVVIIALAFGIFNVYIDGLSFSANVNPQNIPPIPQYG